MRRDWEPESSSKIGRAAETLEVYTAATYAEAMEGLIYIALAQELLKVHSLL